ncbi:hypothetical protein [Streptomyces sp. HB2AG]|uniref:hypothetical protein n=1 Tax=Streptomyces sp. HB2AG TaxID=2983400 RepID=UPI0022AB49FD|nr:hypothetical protein [Streptomyces sp. HB2AG]MCZ2526985.1 hypothetical protein [Streptomyces sp. HB2AG]
MTAACLFLVTGFVWLVAAPALLGDGPVLLSWLVWSAGLVVLTAVAAGGRGGGAALVSCVVLAIAYNIAGVPLRDGVLLRVRGQEVRAVVSAERVESSSRGSRTWIYSFERADGTPVAGGEAVRGSRDFREGRQVTVLEDPLGRIPPTTPGDADPRAEAGFLAGILLVCTAVVIGSARAERAGDRKRNDAVPSEEPLRPTPLGEAMENAERTRLRKQLEEGEFDRRGYIRVNPAHYPGLSYPQAAAVAAEVGLLAEAFGNRGYWRFGRQVVEQVEPA